MKKSFFFLIMISLGLSVSGFTQKARVGVAGGVTVSNMNFVTDGKRETGESMTGFMASMILETPLGKRFAFQPALAYVRKGYRVKTEPFTGAPDTTIRLRYVDIPLNFVFQAGNKIIFYAGVGPVISLNLPSQQVVDIDGAKSSTDLRFGKEVTDNFRGFDYGGNVIVGVRIAKGWFIAANYTQGLRNLMPIEKEGDRILNNYLGIQLGYLFSNNEKK